MALVRYIAEWVDNAGGFIRQGGWVFAPAGLGVYEAALQACANPDLQYFTNGIPTISVAAPGTGAYDLVNDTAVLVFATIPGVTIRVIVPGPISTIFGPSSNVVDPTNPLVAALIAATIGTLADSGGNVVTAYVSGVKGSRRTEQT